MSQEIQMIETKPNNLFLKGIFCQVGQRRAHLDYWLLRVVATGVLSVPAPIVHIDLWHP